MDELTMFASLRPDSDVLSPTDRAALRTSLFGSSTEHASAPDGPDLPLSISEEPDVVLIELASATRRASPKAGRRPLLRVIVAVAAAAIVGAVLVVSSEDRDGPSLGVTSFADEWVAFVDGGDPATSGPNGFHDDDIFVVRKGMPARRVAGTDTDKIEQDCPALSRDGTRLAFGQAAGNSDDGYHDSALVVGELSDGDFTATDTIPVEDASRPPCATWSADGRWLSFAVQTAAAAPTGNGFDEVWVLDTDTGDTRHLTAPSVSDLAWAPDRNELAIASDGLTVYSVATDQLHPLAVAGDVNSLTWSPDGQRMAYQRNAGGSGAAQTKELWLMNADGTNAHRIASGYHANHGIGPVWSPDGSHIVYQQVCAQLPDTGGTCREEHEAVVLTLTDRTPLAPSVTKTVFPPPQTIGTGGEPVWWYPDRVTWSRDSTTLIYDSDGVIAVPLDTDKPPVVLYQAPPA